MLKRMRKESKKMRARRTRVDRMEKEELMRWNEKGRMARHEKSG